MRRPACTLWCANPTWAASHFSRPTALSMSENVICRFGFFWRKAGSRPRPVAFTEAWKLRDSRVMFNFELRDLGWISRRIAQRRRASLVVARNLVVLDIDVSEVMLGCRYAGAVKANTSPSSLAP